MMMEIYRSEQRLLDSTATWRSLVGLIGTVHEAAFQRQRTMLKSLKEVSDSDLHAYMMRYRNVLI
jgi:hypothetical protein